MTRWWCGKPGEQSRNSPAGEGEHQHRFRFHTGRDPCGDQLGPGPSEAAERKGASLLDETPPNDALGGPDRWLWPVGRAARSDMMIDVIDTADGHDGTMWHYTSRSAAEAILRSRTLRCSSIADLGDATELQILPNEIARRKRERTTPEIAEKLRIFGDLRGPADIRGRTSFYVASFSVAKDIPKLWQDFGDRSSGVAIGFSLSAFCNATRFNEDYSRGSPRLVGSRDLSVSLH